MISLPVRSMDVAVPSSAVAPIFDEPSPSPSPVGGTGTGFAGAGCATAPMVADLPDFEPKSPLRRVIQPFISTSSTAVRKLSSNCASYKSTVINAGIGISFPLSKVRAVSRVVNARLRPARPALPGCGWVAQNPAALTDAGLQPFPEKRGHATAPP